MDGGKKPRCQTSQPQFGTGSVTPEDSKIKASHPKDGMAFVLVGVFAPSALEVELFPACNWEGIFPLRPQMTLTLTFSKKGERSLQKMIRCTQPFSTEWMFPSAEISLALRIEPSASAPLE